MRTIARKVLAVLMAAALVALLGIVGRMDYQDRCRDLAPATIEEVR